MELFWQDESLMQWEEGAGLGFRRGLGKRIQGFEMGIQSSSQNRGSTRNLVSSLRLSAESPWCVSRVLAVHGAQMEKTYQ